MECMYNISVLCLCTIPNAKLKLTEDYSIFEYRMKPTLDFRRIVLSKRADVEVLVPLFFQEEIVQSVNKMGSLYK